MVRKSLQMLCALTVGACLYGVDSAAAQGRPDYVGHQRHGKSQKSDARGLDRARERASEQGLEHGRAFDEDRGRSDKYDRDRDRRDKADRGKSDREKAECKSKGKEKSGKDGDSRACEAKRKDHDHRDDDSEANGRGKDKDRDKANRGKSSDKRDNEEARDQKRSQRKETDKAGRNSKQGRGKSRADKPSKSKDGRADDAPTRMPERVEVYTDRLILADAGNERPGVFMRALRFVGITPASEGYVKAFPVENTGSAEE